MIKLERSSPLDRVKFGIGELLQEQEVYSKTKYQKFQERYHDMPDQFMLDCFEWRHEYDEGPTFYQLELARAIPKYRRVAVRGPHGLGKTMWAAQMVLWFALTRDGEDWKIPMTASVWRQLEEYLCPEIKKWARRLRWDIIGREPFVEDKELLKLSLRLNTGSAFAVATDQAETIEGAHASSPVYGKGGLLYLFDEAKIIPDAMWDSAEGAFSTDHGNTFWIAISTPGEPNGRFYDIHSRKKGYEDWYVRKVSKEDAINAGRMGKEWAELRKNQWGENSQLYINKVEGDFASSSQETVIPLSWVEAANERWQDGESLYRNAQVTRIGADVAWTTGDDSSVIAKLRGDHFITMEKDQFASTMETAGHIISTLRAHPNSIVTIEVPAIGAGTYDRVVEVVEEFKMGNDRVLKYNPSRTTNFTDYTGEYRFRDVRSAAWWNLREKLNPELGATLALPPDDKLSGDLTTPRWKMLSDGKILVESKDNIKKRLHGKSTDEGDAVVICMWDDEEVWDFEVKPFIWSR